MLTKKLYSAVYEISANNPSMTISHFCNKCNCFQWLLYVAVSILNTRIRKTAHQNGMQSSLKLLFTHVYTSAVPASTVENSPPSLLGSTGVLSGGEQPSGHSRRAQKCSSDFWQNTEEKGKHVYVNALSKSNPGAYSITFTSTFSQKP